MSDSGGNSGAKKKFFSLVIYMMIVLIIFMSVIGLWVVAGKTPPTPVSNNSSLNAGNYSIVDANVPGSGNETANETKNNTAVKGPVDIAKLDDSVVVTFLKAIDIAASSEEIAPWLENDANWSILLAEANYMDDRGLSSRWTIALRSSTRQMMVEVVDGVAVNPRSYVIDEIGLPSLNSMPLYDSSLVVGKMIRERDILVVPGSMAFSFHYMSYGSDGVYEVKYLDSKTFDEISMRFDPRTGNMIDDVPGGQ